MSGVDERVVDMKFNNQQFERNAATTLSTLDKLKAALHLGGAAKGIAELQAAGNKFNLNGMSAGVDTLSAKFSALTVVGVTALATIANKAVVAGLELTKSLTISPIKAGFDEYELKMKSIQTILANTSRYGTKLGDVNKALDELNKYADKTIYSFADMTANIGRFTNAGIRLEDATKMIQGFSNAAAASGTSAEAASGAAYQLSQALNNGKITLMDWKSITNAGMGSANMRDGLISIANAMDTFKGKGITAKDAQKNFNASLEKGWMTSEVMSKYLKIMATDFASMDKAELAHQKTQLKSLGLSDKQINALIKQQIDAQNAATKVRTLSGLFATLKESISSGWAETFGIIFGDFNEATELFSGAYEAINKIFSGMTDARNKLLNDWKTEGGRTAAIDAIKNAWAALGSIVGPIKEAFRDVFPAMTGKRLADITKSFRDFMGTLKLGPENMDKLKTTFTGLFSILKVGWDILKGVVGFFAGFFSVAQGGSGGILSLTAAVGGFITKLHEWIEAGGGISGFFDKLGEARDAVIKPLVEWIGKIVDAFQSLIKGDVSGFFDQIGASFSVFAPLVQFVQEKFGALSDTLSTAAGKASDFLSAMGSAALQPIIELIDRIKQKFDDISESFGATKDKLTGLVPKIDSSGLDGVGDKLNSIKSGAGNVTHVWDGLISMFENLKEFLKPAADAISRIFTAITDKFATWIEEMDFQDAVALLNTGFFIAMYAAFRKFLTSMEGIGKSIAGSFDALTASLKTMQQDVKANMILKIAIAVGVLALSLKLLSTIDAEQMKTGLAGLAGIMVLLTVNMAALLKMTDKLGGSGLKDSAKLVAMGATLVLLAGAILILSYALKNMSSLNWEEMKTGLIATAALIVALGIFAKLADSGKISFKGAIGLIAMAGAVAMLSFAVEKLGKMDIDTLKQGGIAIAAIILLLTASSVAMGKFGAKGAAGFVAMAAALGILIPVIITLGMLPMDVLQQGMIALAIGLGLLTASAVAMGLAGAKGGPGMLAMAAALAVLVPTLIVLGTLPFDVLKQGLIGLAVGLGLMTAATILMGKFGAQAIPGLLAMSAALVVLAGAIYILGNMDADQLKMALLGLAAGLAILLVAAVAAIYLAPGLAALGATFALLGAAMLMAGVGMLAFAAGFALLAAVGAAGVAVLIMAFEGILNLIPLFAQQLALGVIAFAKVISDAGPVLVEALTVIIISLLQAIQNAAPQFFSTLRTLIMGLITTITEMIPEIAEAGIQMIIGLLQGIADNIYRVVTTATKIITEFLRAIGDNGPKIMDEGANTIVKLLNGIADAIEDHSQEMRDAGMRIARAIIDGITGGITDLASTVWESVSGMAQGAVDAIQGVFDSNSPSKVMIKEGHNVGDGLVIGFRQRETAVADAAENVGHAAIDSMRTTLSSLANILEGETDFNPVITPVLDLSNVESNASSIRSLLGTQPLSVKASYNNALNATASYSDESALTADSAAKDVAPFVFNQNNYSPEPLKTIDIYRNTNNLISAAKGVVPS